MKVRPAWYHRVSDERAQRPVNVFLVLLGCVLLQVTVPNIVALYEALRVQFALIAVVCFSLQQDWFGSAMTGAAGGLVMDMFSGGRVGIYALSYGIIGLVIGRVQEKLFKDNLLTVAAVIFGASILSSILVFNVLGLYGTELDYAGQLAERVLPSSAANVIVGCAVFSVLRRIRRERSAYWKGSDG